jgi:hypothetical protein
VRVRDLHALQAHSFEMEIDGFPHVVFNLLTRASLETHPGKSGEYAEYPVLVCSMTIRNFFISSAPLVSRCY